MRTPHARQRRGAPETLPARPAGGHAPQAPTKGAMPTPPNGSGHGGHLGPLCGRPQPAPLRSASWACGGCRGLERGVLFVRDAPRQLQRPQGPSCQRDGSCSGRSTGRHGGGPGNMSTPRVAGRGTRREPLSQTHGRRPTDRTCWKALSLFLKREGSTKSQPRASEASSCLRSGSCRRDSSLSRMSARMGGPGATLTGWAGPGPGRLEGCGAAAVLAGGPVRWPGSASSVPAGPGALGAGPGPRAFHRLPRAHG